MPQAGSVEWSTPKKGLKCCSEVTRMGSLQTSEPRTIREWKWSPAEKLAARRAFDLALNRELEAVMREAKARSAKVEDPSELWELERWLGDRRREIDRTF